MYKEVKMHRVSDEIIDRDELLERVDGDQELLEELFLIFVEEMPIQLKAIEEALNRQSCADLEKSAHRLKGGLGNLSAKEAYNLAAAMEMAASQDDLAKVNYLFADLVRETNLALEALGALIRNNGFWSRSA